MKEEIITCVSCSDDYPASKVRYTHRHEEDLPLCLTCWNAALQVQKMLHVENKAEYARDRWLGKQEVA
jgi:hypothetical protein